MLQHWDRRMDNNTTEEEAFEESLVDLEVNYVDTCLLNANQQCHCQKVNCRFIIKIVVINCCCWGLSGNLAMYAGAHVSSEAKFCTVQLTYTRHR